MASKVVHKVVTVDKVYWQSFFVIFFATAVGVGGVTFWLDLIFGGGNSWQSLVIFLVGCEFFVLLSSAKVWLGSKKKVVHEIKNKGGGKL